MNRRVLPPLPLLLVLGLGLSSTAGAQERDAPPTLGGAAGLGGGWGTEGVAIVLEGFVRYGRHQFAGRVSAVSDIFENGFYDVGFLYGYVLAPTALDLSVGAGVAYAGVETCPGLLQPGPCERHRTVGLPLSLRLLFAPIPYVGVGLHGFANLNPDRSFGGLTLVVYVGKLR